MNTKVYACEIRDNNDNILAARYFRTREEADNAQFMLLSFDWFGYMSAPIVSTYNKKEKGLKPFSIQDYSFGILYSTAMISL